MKRTGKRFVTAALLCLTLLFSSVATAWAGDLDYNIQRYDVTVTPNAQDGSLLIRLDFQWEVLDEGPVEWLQIGVPNGSIREVTPLTDNIDSLSFDNSFMYIYFDRGYDDGEVIRFSYSWVQEYMYTLDGAAVTYDYTPGWFDSAKIGIMTLTWNPLPAPAPSDTDSVSWSGGTWTDLSDSAGVPHFEGRDLGHGDTVTYTTRYDSWPTELFWENSAENLPGGSGNWDDWEDWNDDYYYDDSGDDIGDFFAILFLILVVVFIVTVIAASDGYSGGFGTRYVLYRGLWYPAGRDGRPRPGSTGLKKKPAPPRRSSGSGISGGRRGGGFGGGGFGGGGHCACASSCACACACACAGGGRAGCSAKNLYGAIRLSREVTEDLMD